MENWPGEKGANLIEHSRFNAVIADDHEIVRDGLKAALQTPGLVEPDGISVIGEAENGLETLAKTKALKPDLLLLDLMMPMSGGAEVFTDVRRWSPQTKVVVYSSSETAGMLGILVSAGIDGMFAKGGSNQLLYDKLPLILRGGRFIAPECLALIGPAETDFNLTARERQTLSMILAGRTTKEIAEQQGISPRTTEKHRASLMSKLGAGSVAELMATALKRGLI